MKTKKTITAAQFRKRYVKKLLPSGVTKRTEQQEQAALCKWLKGKYPNVLYTVDLGGIPLTKTQRAIHQTRAKRGHPDLLFQQWYGDRFCGLAIEFKRTGVKVLNLKNQPKNEHIIEQLAYLISLQERCYFAVFVSGLENAKKVIDCYLEGRNLEMLNNIIYPKIKT